MKKSRSGEQTLWTKYLLGNEISSSNLWRKAKIYWNLDRFLFKWKIKLNLCFATLKSLINFSLKGKKVEKHHYFKLFIQLLERQCSSLGFGEYFFPLVPLALEQVQNNCLCTLLQILHNFKHTNWGSCKLHSENIAHLCLQHYKQWQDVLNNLFSQIILTSWRSTICSLTPNAWKKPQCFVSSFRTFLWQ